MTTSDGLVLWCDVSQYESLRVKPEFKADYWIHIAQNVNSDNMATLDDCEQAHRLAYGDQSLMEASTNKFDEQYKEDTGQNRPKDDRYPAVSTADALPPFPDKLFDQPPAPTFKPPKQGGKGPKTNMVLNSFGMESTREDRVRTTRTLLYLSKR